MATDLTSVAIKDGFSQLLHCDGGLSSTETAVLDGDGTSSTLSLGTTSATIAGNLVISGNLTVSGTTTEINTQTLNVADNIVVLNNDVTGTPSQNAGIEIERGTSTNTVLRWNESSDRWEFTNDGSTFYNIPISTEYNNYTLPTASSSTLGGIKVGTNLSIDGSGVLSSSGGFTSFTIADTDSTQAIADGVHIKFAASNSGSYGNSQITGSGTSGSPYLITLNVPDPDTNTFRTVTAGGNTLGASETLAFTAGSNVTITENAGAVTIASTDTNTDTVDMGDGFRLVDIDSNVQVTENKYVKFKTASGGSGFGDITGGDGSSGNPWIYQLQYTDTNTVYSVMGSGNSYAAGLVLAGSATHNNNFLRKDGSWRLPNINLQDDDADSVSITIDSHVKIIGSGGISTDWTTNDAGGSSGSPNVLTIGLGSITQVGALSQGSIASGFSTIDEGFIDSDIVRKNANTTITGIYTFSGKGIAINAGTASNASGYDASLYVSASNDNDWGIWVDKASTNYGIRVTTAADANSAFIVQSSSANKFVISGSGTVTTGSWNGSVITSAYLDSDTAHLSSTQTFSGAKTFSAVTTFSNTSSYGDLDIIPTSGNRSVIKHDSGSGSLTLRGDQINLQNKDGDETGLTYNDGGGVTLNGAVNFLYGNIYLQTNNKALIGYNTSGGAKELIKIDGSNVVQIGEGLNTTFAGDVNINSDYLTISNTAQNGIKIKTDDTAVIWVYDKTSDAITGGVNWGHSDGTTIFYTGGINERMRITSAGDVMLGNQTMTDHQYQTLGIRGDASDGVSSVTLLTANASNTSGRNWGIASNYSAHGNLDFRYSANKDDTPFANLAMTINSTGRIGVGTASPTDLLSITDGASMYAADSKRMIQLKRNATNGHDDNSFCAILFGNNSNGMHIGYGGTTDRFRFIDGGGVERLSILNGGNIGIGTTSPSNPLQIAYSNASGTDYLDGDAILYLANSGSDGTMIKFGDTNAGLVYGGSGSGTFKLMQRENTAVFINSSRNVSIGGTGGYQKLTVEGGNIYMSTGQTITWSNGNATINNTGFELRFGTYSGSALIERMRIESDGDVHCDADVIAFSSTIGSDRRLKKNIADIKYGLNDVLKLRGVEFDWNRKDYNKKHDVGFIAQEVQEVIPELVKRVSGLNNKDSFLTVDYAKLVPVLVESIKELKQEIKDLKNVII